MEIIRGIEQGSPEWFQQCMASIGGSSISKAVAGGRGKMRNDLMNTFIGEILSGVPHESFKFQHADRGLDLEGGGRDAFAFQYDVEVEQVAMVKAGPHKHYSPDGLFADLLEIKTRIPKTHIEALRTGKIPTSDRKQIQWGLSICERDKCYYVQYCPEMGYGLDLFVTEIGRDEKEIKVLHEGADKFIEEMLQIIEELKAA